MSAPQPLEFGPFRLLSPQGPLVRGSEELKLQPKALSLLWLLAEHPREVLSKQTLLDALWPGLPTGDEALSYQINALRKALGEDAKQPRYIETVHRIGLRFLGESRGAGSGPASPVAPVFVGRDRELDRLRAAWVRAQQGGGAATFLVGEAGIGKTALIEQFLRAESLDPQTIAWGCCLESYGNSQAYLPIIEALFDWVRSDSGGNTLDLVEQLAPSWLRLMPSLLQPGQREALDRELASASPDRIQREFLDLMDALSRDRPRILCLEDLHWSDPATVALLQRLGRRRRTSRLLLLCSLRPVEAILADHPVRLLQRHLIASGEAEQVLLQVLEPVEATRLIGQRWPRSALDVGIAQAIASKSGGHPLFLVQMLEYLSRLPPDQRLGVDDLDQMLPERLTELVDLQLGQLSLTEQLLLESASLVGVDFSVAAVAAVTQLGEEAVEQGLDRLLAQGQFIRAAGLEVWPDGTTSTAYRFRHALYERILRQKLGPSRRRRMHQALAERLSQAYGPRSAEIASSLTLHFEHAGQLRAAVRAGIHVAQAALLTASTAAVLAQRDRGLALLARLNLEAEDHHLEMALRLTAAAALQMERGYWTPEATPDLARIQVLLPDVRDPVLLEKSLHQLWVHAYSGLRYAETEHLCDRIHALSEQYNIPRLAAAAHAWRSHLFLATGRTREACEQAERALQVAAQHGAGTEAQQPWYCVIGAHLGSASARWALGHPDQSLRAARQSVEVAERCGAAVDVAIAYGMGPLLVHLHRGEWHAVLEAGERPLQVARRYGFLDAGLWIERHMALAAFHLRPGREALQAIQQTLDAQRRRGGEMSIVMSDCHYAECCLLVDEPELAQVALQTARALAEKVGMVGWRSEILRLEALVLRRRRGSTAAIEQGLRAALDLADSRDAKSLALRAALDLQALLAEDGREKEGRALLQVRYDAFTEGFEAIDLRRAAQRLAAVAADRDP